MPRNHTGPCSAQHYSQARSGEKEGFITFSKYRDHQRSFQKQCLLEQQNWGSFKLRVDAYSQASLAAQLVKNPLAMQETWVQSLGWKDPLEKETATHSSIVA